MYVLGYLCTQLEITLHLQGAKPYELAAPELFIDLYVLCCLLLLIPQKVRRWVRWGVAIVLYVIAFIDMFCYVRFESTLTPTMLMLAQETDSRETSEFFRTFVGFDLLTTKVGWVLLILAVHVVWALCIRAYQAYKAHKLNGTNKPYWSYKPYKSYKPYACAVLGVLCVVLLALSVNSTYANKSVMLRLFSYDNIGDVEHDLTRKDAANLYLPVYRMAFSLYANHLAGKQLDQLTIARQDISVDSCSFRTPTIVLIIGESYNKYHSQLYGYDKATTPRQMERAQDSSLVVFTDVVAPWNLTSYVFKHALSLHAVGDKGDWCDAPLFPELFRKAGYHVSFFTNQFMSKASEKVYDFSGGFFLNNPELSSALFDERNTKLFPYDEGLLSLNPQPSTLRPQPSPLHPQPSALNPPPSALIIYHLMGQHLDYYSRYPKNRRRFTAADYDRPDLTAQRLKVLSDYDNATAYNDSVVDQIIRRYEQQDAVVIYMPDHAEEAHNKPRPMYGRLHSVKIDRRLAREEFEIPFWIWCSPLNRQRHPDIYASVKAARQRPFMTDNLPHLLLSLAGIHTKYYRADYDLLSTQYNAKRPRLLKNQVDYNKLKVEN
ncbi:MAG: phosphoethanolamine transferase [Prevotella sp.]|nr:phosphoethanolamine transferase [Prevotella sp.]